MSRQIIISDSDFISIKLTLTHTLRDTILEIPSFFLICALSKYRAYRFVNNCLIRKYADPYVLNEQIALLIIMYYMGHCSSVISFVTYSGKLN